MGFAHRSMNENVKIDYDTTEKVMDLDGSKVYVKTIGDKTSMKIMMIPGFSWAKSVGPKLPKLADGSCPQWCPATHFGYQTQGTCKIKFERGRRRRSTPATAPSWTSRIFLRSSA